MALLLRIPRWSLFLRSWSEPRSHVWLGCNERFTWLTVLTRPPVFRVTVFILLDAETLVSLVSLLFGQQRWNLVDMREYLNGSEHLCICVSFFTVLVSVSVWSDTGKISMALPKNVDTHQSRWVVKFCVAQFLRFCVFFFFPLKGEYFALLLLATDMSR